MMSKVLPRLLLLEPDQGGQEFAAGGGYAVFAALGRDIADHGVDLGGFAVFEILEHGGPPVSLRGNHAQQPIRSPYCKRLVCPFPAEAGQNVTSTFSKKLPCSATTSMHEEFSYV